MGLGKDSNIYQITLRMKTFNPVSKLLLGVAIALYQYATPVAATCSECECASDGKCLCAVNTTDTCGMSECTTDCSCPAGGCDFPKAKARSSCDGGSCDMPLCTTECSCSGGGCTMPVKDQIDYTKCKDCKCSKIG